jgi:hypothetical protein
LSDLLTNSMGGEFPAFTINYERLKIAKGNLTGARSADATIDGTNINFSWVDNSGEGDASAEDEAILTAVSDTAYPLVSLGAVTRGAATGNLAVPDGTSGSVFHCYLAFAGTDGRTQVSNSIYLGEVAIP